MVNVKKLQPKNTDKQQKHISLSVDTLQKADEIRAYLGDTSFQALVDELINNAYYELKNHNLI